METKEFLKAVLGNEGWYCAVGITNGKPKQKFYDDIDALLETSNRFNDNDIDAYYALATFGDPQETDSPRAANNVHQLKSFFIDIDCGPKKPYMSKKEAAIALVEFCKSTEIPLPIMVDSGGGIHAYWYTEKPMSIEDWFPVATKLKNTCLSKGLEIDKAVTADAARILRVPGTRNFKLTDNPRAVSIKNETLPGYIDLAEFSSKLGEDKLIPVLPVTNAIPKEFSATMNALMGNVDHKFKHILERTGAGNGCAQIAFAVKNREELEEPIWRAALSIAKFCSDGESYAHKMSEDYPDYDPDETDRKLDQIKGPYTCAVFNDLNPGVCDGCPFSAKIKSPIQLGRETLRAEDEDNIVPEPKATVAPPTDPNRIPTYPSPYFRGKTGGIYIDVMEPDEDGKPVKVAERCVYHNDIYVSRRVKDAEVGEALVVNVILPQDGRREFLLPLTSATSREEFRRALSMQGVAVTKWEPLMKYIETWLHELQQRSKADESHRQFGWTKDHKSFILGDREITPNEILINHPTPPTSKYFEAMAPKGTLEGWREMAMMYAEDEMPIHQYVMASSFGSVLLTFFPKMHSGALHLYSKGSGFGKTWLKDAALSAWGDPDVLRMKGKDTENSIMLRAELLKSLPLVLDELGDISPQQASGIYMTMSDGKQKERMMGGGNLTRLRGEPWALFIISSANQSLVERISTIKGAPTAEAQRILEINVEGYDYYRGGKGAERSRHFGALMQENSGLVGQMFVQYVLQNMEEVTAMLTKMNDVIVTRFQLSPENRFWSIHITCTLVANIICRRLGIMDYSTETLMKAAARLVKYNKEKVVQITRESSEVLNEYINENIRNILYVNSKKDLRKGVFGDNGIDILNKQLEPNKIIGRYEPDTEMLYVVPRPFRNWCLDQRMNYTEIVNDLKKDHGAKSQKFRLTKGYKMDLGVIHCLVINAKDFIEFKDDETIAMLSSEKEIAEIRDMDGQRKYEEANRPIVERREQDDPS